MCLAVPDCNIAQANDTVCPIEGAVAQTAYGVTATAFNTDNTASAVSTAANFTTPQHA